MRKSNLIKSIVCGLMLTAVVGTTALAASGVVQVDNGDYVNGVERYYDEYYGTYGKFMVDGTYNRTQIKVVNNNSVPRTYFIQVREYNYASDEYSAPDSSTPTLTPGGSDTAYVTRYCDDYRYAYEHLGRSYSANTVNSVIIDNYNCKLYQYN